jgi:soluble lytic murein transglycosylase-like protein
MYYFIEQYADSFDIPKNYAFGIAHLETGYDGPFDWKYNHKRASEAGAVGPMQIMPATARLVNGGKVAKTKLKTNIEYNVMTSMKLLRQLYDKYGDWKLVFGCYNTGRPVVNRYALKVYNYVPDWKIQEASN